MARSSAIHLCGVELLSGVTTLELQIPPKCLMSDVAGTRLWREVPSTGSTILFGRSCCLTWRSGFLHQESSVDTWTVDAEPIASVRVWPRASSMLECPWPHGGNVSTALGHRHKYPMLDRRSPIPCTIDGTQPYPTPVISPRDHGDCTAATCVAVSKCRFSVQKAAVQPADHSSRELS